MLKRLKSGEVTPEKLTEMTSAERRAFLTDIVGEANAGPTNALFESKLLLKNQQQGIITWAKQITGIKPEVRRDLLSRVEKMTEVLQPQELDTFLEDLAAKRLGVAVSVEEAGRIADLAARVQETKAAMANGSDRMDYGRAKVDFYNYVNGLKKHASERTVKEIAVDVIKHPIKSTAEFGGTSKSLNASVDESAIFRQGWKTMMTNPWFWAKNGAKMFSDTVKVFGGKEVMDEIQADIISQPTYDQMVKGKLAVGTVEEAFPNSFPERIPVLGRVYKASEVAYTGFIYRQRADIFNKMLDIAKRSGIDTTDKARLEGIGAMINSLTGRGYLGPAEPAADFFNNIFFSPRLFASHFQVLAHPLTGAGGGSFVRKQAALNLAKMIAGTAAIIALANLLKPGSAELDPRSSDFGTIKIGSTRFDITGGMRGVLTLAARLLTWSTKNQVGDITAINSGEYGAQTGMDVVSKFMEGKFAPLMAAFKDLVLTGTDFAGNPTSIPKEALGLVTPLTPRTAIELFQDKESAGVLAGTIAETLGISANSYGAPSVLANDQKPEVLHEVLDALAKGDAASAQSLAHDFNERLRDAITIEVTKSDRTGDEDKVEAEIEKKFNADAIYMPDEQDVIDYKANNTDVVERILKSGKPIVVKETPIPTQGVIGTVLTYARAIGADPVTAFNDIFKGQKIRMVTNGTVIVERMSLKDSQKVKNNRGGNNPEVKLDHTLPLELGGNNEEGNLALVPTETWQSYTPVENYLGKKLRAGAITKQEAQESILAFKRGETTFDDITNKFGNE